MTLNNYSRISQSSNTSSTRRVHYLATTAFILLFLYILGVFSPSKQSNSSKSSDFSDPQSSLDNLDSVVNSGANLQAESGFQDTVVRAEWQKSASRNKYDIVEGVCFIGHDVAHANNRQGDYDACFAACLGYNLNVLTSNAPSNNQNLITSKSVTKISKRNTQQNVNLDDFGSFSQENEANGGKCVGWTTKRHKKVSSTHTCFLKMALDEQTAIKSEDCSSARLWQEALDYYGQDVDGVDDESDDVIGNENGNYQEVDDEEEDEYLEYSENEQEAYSYYQYSLYKENSDDDYDEDLDIAGNVRSDASLDEKEKGNSMEKNADESKANDFFDLSSASSNSAAFVVKTNKSSVALVVPSKTNADTPNETPVAKSLLAYNEKINLKACTDAKQSGNTSDENVYGRSMRTFIFCMQSSGCTLLSYLLGQKESAISVLDVGVRQEIPEQSYFIKAHQSYPNINNIILKMSTRGELHDMNTWMQNVRNNYNQDYTILFVHNPVDSLLHLLSHIGVGTEEEPTDEEFSDCAIKDFSQFSYGLRCGTPVSKLKALNAAFVNQKQLGVDRVVKYEDLCSRSNRESVVKNLRKDGFCINFNEFNDPEHSIIEVMKKTIKLLPSSKTDDESVMKQRKSLFWGAGHLQNTFHHKESGDYLNQTEAFSKCVPKLSDRERKDLLEQSGAPYNNWKLQDVIELAKAAAPDLFSYYDKSRSKTGKVKLKSKTSKDGHLRQ